jgi:hypothetical protein
LWALIKRCVLLLLLHDGSAAARLSRLVSFQFVNLDIIGFIIDQYILMYIMLGCFGLTVLAGSIAVAGRCLLAYRAKRQEEDRKTSLARY